MSHFLWVPWRERGFSCRASSAPRPTPAFSSPPFSFPARLRRSRQALHRCGGPVLPCFPSRSGHCLRSVAASVLPSLRGSSRSTTRGTRPPAAVPRPDRPPGAAPRPPQSHRSLFGHSRDTQPAAVGKWRPPPQGARGAPRFSARPSACRAGADSAQGCGAALALLLVLAPFLAVLCFVSHLGRNTYPSLAINSSHIQYCSICSSFSSEKNSSLTTYFTAARDNMMKKFAL